MSAAPSEPEKYSIDEMMERLRNAPSENPADGERVTRSDGSQSIRVRKRKRRSNQPQKDIGLRTLRARIIQVSAALVLIFAAALTVGGAIVYANSSPFRDGLVRKIQQTSGAEIELQQFRMNPKTANAGSLALAWPDGNALKSLSLQGLNAEIFPASFLGKSFIGEEITIASGTLELQVPKSGQALRSIAALTDAPSIRFKRYRTPRFQLRLGDVTSPAIRLTNSEASLSPETINGRPKLSLYKGDLSIIGWPKLRLDRALVEFRGADADIISLRMLHESDDRGTFELKGTVSPCQPEQPSSLAVTLDSFQLSGIVGPSLGRLFSGRIESVALEKSNCLSFLPTQNSLLTLDIAFRASPTSKIELQGFPFLIALARSLDDPWFEHPVFEGDSGGVIHRENGVASIREIDFNSKGRMAVRGQVSVTANQTLSGNLEVGIAEAVVAAAPTLRLQSMFGPSKDGFRWITLKINGPASAPTDNFKELFSASPAIPAKTAAPAEETGSTFEELTRPK
jgi:hypothetical protein